MPPVTGPEGPARNRKARRAWSWVQGRFFPWSVGPKDRRIVSPNKKEYRTSRTQVKTYRPEGLKPSARLTFPKGKPG